MTITRIASRITCQWTDDGRWVLADYLGTDVNPQMELLALEHARQRSPEAALRLERRSVVFHDWSPVQTDLKALAVREPGAGAKRLFRFIDDAVGDLP